jgi:hypothetical protein
VFRIFHGQLVSQSGDAIGSFDSFIATLGVCFLKNQSETFVCGLIVIVTPDIYPERQPRSPDNQAAFLESTIEGQRQGQAPLVGHLVITFYNWKVRMYHLLILAVLERTSRLHSRFEEERLLHPSHVWPICGQNSHVADD